MNWNGRMQQIRTTWQRATAKLKLMAHSNSDPFYNFDRYNLDTKVLSSGAGGWSQWTSRGVHNQTSYIWTRRKSVQKSRYNVKKLQSGMMTPKIALKLLKEAEPPSMYAESEHTQSEYDNSEDFVSHVWRWSILDNNSNLKRTMPLSH